MLRSGLRWVVIDSKHDKGFDELTGHEGLIDPAKLSRYWREGVGIFVVRPKPREYGDMDAYLEELHESYDNFGVCVDEVYQVSGSTTRAGPGLTGLVTRGRARKQAVILGSQRPAWVPRFVYSEANGIVVMSLTMKQDRERILEMTAQRIVMEPLESRHWLYCDIAAQTVTRYAPVTIEETPP